MADGTGAPVAVRDGWPERLPGAGVVATEAGVALGALGLPGSGYAVLRGHAPLRSLRLDDRTFSDWVGATHGGTARGAVGWWLPPGSAGRALAAAVAARYGLPAVTLDP